MEKFLGKLKPWQFEEIPPIGNSPTFIAKEDLDKITNTWLNVSRTIFDTPETRKVRGDFLHIEIILPWRAGFPWLRDFSFKCCVVGW